MFDLDGTLTKRNCSYSFYFYLLKEGIVSRATLPKMISLFFLFRFRFIDLATLHQKVFSTLFLGIAEEKVKKAAATFLPPFLRSTLRPAILKRLQEAKEKNERVYLLSSSPYFITEIIGEILSFDRAIGTQYSVDNTGRVCDICRLVTGFEKRIIAKQVSERASHVFAYSDSVEDLPLLEWASHPIVVFPDKKLYQIAQKRGWPVIKN